MIYKEKIFNFYTYRDWEVQVWESILDVNLSLCHNMERKVLHRQNKLPAQVCSLCLLKPLSPQWDPILMTLPNPSNFLRSPFQIYSHMTLGITFPQTWILDRQPYKLEDSICTMVFVTTFRVVIRKKKTLLSKLRDFFFKKYGGWPCVLSRLCSWTAAWVSKSQRSVMLRAPFLPQLMTAAATFTLVTSNLQRK